MRRILFSILISLILSISYGQYFPPIIENVDFEAPTTDIVIVPTSGNLWQICKPNKLFFDTAWSPTHTILTDSIGYYPPNNTSSFIYTIRHPTTGKCTAYTQFFHKYDMDTLGDKGIIDASYDGGITWVLLKDTTFSGSPISYFSWDDDFNYYSSSNCITSLHKLITSGNSHEWIMSRFWWQWRDTSLTNTDSLMIRFTFISDSIVKNKEGWMIDNISTTSWSGNCLAGIEENQYINNLINIYPNPTSSSIQVSCSDNNFINEITLFDLLGNKVINTKEKEIDVSSFNEGVYTLSIKSNEKIINKKLIVQHK